MTLKNIIEGVVILVIALLIFSYIVDPTVKYKIKNAFSEVKSDIKSNIKEVHTTKEISCEEKAKELFPENITVKYRFLEDISPSSDYTGQYGTWKDGSSFSGNSGDDTVIAIALSFRVLWATFIKKALSVPPE